MKSIIIFEAFSSSLWMWNIGEWFFDNFNFPTKITLTEPAPLWLLSELISFFMVNIITDELMKITRNKNLNLQMVTSVILWICDRLLFQRMTNQVKRIIHWCISGNMKKLPSLHRYKFITHNAHLFAHMIDSRRWEGKYNEHQEEEMCIWYCTQCRARFFAFFNFLNFLQRNIQNKQHSTWSDLSA